MAKPSDVAVVETDIEFVPLSFRAPLKFGGRVLTETDIVNVRARVRSRDGKEGVGLGSMPLGNVWAWPSSVTDATQSAEAMRRVATAIAREARSLTQPAHPLELVHELSQRYRPLADQFTREMGLPESMPDLALLVAASTIDAALHDAQGKALNQSSFDLLGPEHCDRDLSHYLTDEFRGEFLDRYTSRRPKPRLPLYHLVGALDPLTHDELREPLDDGLPQTLDEWIANDGLTHLKIKLNGDDLTWDLERTLAVDALASATRPSADWRFSLDFNERCPSADYVLEFLRKMRERSSICFDRVQYIEQPTHRDLKAHPENRMHAAAKIKPVVIDESLVNYESLRLAREQGYSGVALKACKGHTEALLMGAAAQKHKMFLCVQDLTCPGASFLHSAELAARIPGVAAIEGNGRQYCPAGNVGWSERFPSMFHITDGSVGTAALDGPGLGH